MPPQASPLPIRSTARVNPASSSSIDRRKFDFGYDSEDEIEDQDDLAADHIPCSPYFTQPTQRVTQPTQRVTQPTQIVTQPTQLVSRTTLKPIPTPIPSSPRSVVEVPCSSPIQQQKPRKLASLMAPAGTTFRAPMAPPSNSSRKRDFSNISSDAEDNPIIIFDDSSDDEGPNRGDIALANPRQTKPAAAAASAKQSEDDDEDDEEDIISKTNMSEPALMKLGFRMLKELKKMGLVGVSKDIDACKRALVRNKRNIDDAIGYIIDQNEKKPKPTTTSSTKDMIRSFAHPGPVTSSSPPPPSPPSKRRRLVQGRRDVVPPSSQQEVPTKATEPVVVIESDDEEEDYGNQESQSSSGDDEDEATARALKLINDCTTKDLVAVLGSKFRVRVEELLSHPRPFKSVGAVQRIKSAKKSRGKAAEIGEDIFDALLDYVKALQAIDIIVGKCAKEGAVMKKVFGTWNVDRQGVKLADPPLTPLSTDSTSSQLVDLPIAKEPKAMRGYCEMKTYQLYGLNWMAQLYEQKFGGILADDMGLGKTCQVVSFISHLVDLNNSGTPAKELFPNLVVVPPSTLANWEAEFEKFAPNVKVTLYSGSQGERAEIAEDILESREDHHVILTSYTQIDKKDDIKAMRDISPNVAIFDEGHKMKNSSTKIYQNLIRIPANWRLILTGTPVQNNIMEMINLLHFIQPKLFAKHLEQLEALFTQKVSLKDVSNGALNFSDRVKRARSILEPFILQRKKEQVLLDIPPKTRRVVLCDMIGTQKGIYEKYERQFKSGKDQTQATKTKSSISATADDQNNVWMQLRKAAVHEHLFRRHFTDDKVNQMAKILFEQTTEKNQGLVHLTNELKDASDMDLHTWCRDYPRLLKKFDLPEDSWMENGKIQELIKLLNTCKENGDRVLIFTRFAKGMNVLRECLASAGIDYLTLEGATGVGDRQPLIDQFNDDPSITAFVLTTGAGGTGINLTAANKVVFLDPSDNPQDDLQAENRAHRMGQLRPVEIIKLISKGTIEELIYKACEKKLELANKVTGWDEEAPEQVAKEIQKEVTEMFLAGGVAPTPMSSEEE